MCCQPNGPRLVLPVAQEDRLTLLVLARDLERAMDSLPTESPWWTLIQKFYEQLTDAVLESE